MWLVMMGCNDGSIVIVVVAMMAVLMTMVGDVDGDGC